MVVELLIIVSLLVGFAAGMLISKYCFTRAPEVVLPSEVFLDLFMTKGPFGEVFMAPTGSRVYHLHEDCHHLGPSRGDYITARTCKDCLRDKAFKEMRDRKKTM